MSDLERELKVEMIIRDTLLKNLLVSCVLVGVAIGLKKSSKSSEEEIVEGVVVDEHLG